MFSEKDIEGMFAHLMPLHEKMNVVCFLNCYLLSVSPVFPLSYDLARPRCHRSRKRVS
jgi:hypothetical protein